MPPWNGGETPTFGSRGSPASKLTQMNNMAKTNYVLIEKIFDGYKILQDKETKQYAIADGPEIYSERYDTIEETQKQLAFIMAHYWAG